MREIHVDRITEVVSDLCQRANRYLPEDVVAALRATREQETSDTAREIVDQLLRNAEIAAEETIPLCQDTGVAVVFADLGQEVHIVGGGLQDAVKN